MKKILKITELERYNLCDNGKIIIDNMEMSLSEKKNIEGYYKVRGKEIFFLNCFFYK